MDDKTYIAKLVKENTLDDLRWELKARSLNISCSRLVNRLKEIENKRLQHRYLINAQKLNITEWLECATLENIKNALSILIEEKHETPQDLRSQLVETCKGIDAENRFGKEISRTMKKVTL